MPIHHAKGGTTLTGDSIAFFRLAAMRSAVYLETKGIRMTRGPVMWKRAAKDYGIKGNRQAVLVWLNAEVERQRALQVHTGETS